MIIALDYDDTYDRAPPFWDQMIAAAARRGHTVIVVTRRHEHERPVIPAWPDIPIFCTGREPKVRHMRGSGIEVGIWIDDDPAGLLSAPWLTPASSRRGFRALPRVPKRVGGAVGLHRRG